MGRPKARWPSSCYQAVFRVFVELSLAEMLHQQQSEACLYHGQEVSKKCAEYFFHGKCAFVFTLQHPRLRYGRVPESFTSGPSCSKADVTRVSFYFFQKHFLGQFSLIFIEHRIINFLTKRIELNLLYKLSYLNSNFALFKPWVILTQL